MLGLESSINSSSNIGEREGDERRAHAMGKTYSDSLLRQHVR